MKSVGASDWEMEADWFDRKPNETEHILFSGRRPASIRVDDPRLYYSAGHVKLFAIVTVFSEPAALRATAPVLNLANMLMTGAFTGAPRVNPLQIGMTVPQSRKPFRAFGSNEGSKPSPSAPEGKSRATMRDRARERRASRPPSPTA